jgi:collagen beta-1,O-galactosyltransferase
VKQLEGYEDPYLKRPLKLGEIGCFLSHYYIWEEVVAKNYKQVIIMEDDLKFKPDFKSQLASAMREVQDLELEWDLIYLSRKILTGQDSSRKHPATHNWSFYIFKLCNILSV